ncbi:MAG: outer membrane protein assembly factor BamA [Rhodobacteraceae bacterium]|nr:outer membrane protein assembly factor BamA [Paracoccaceae bacterium]
MARGLILLLIVLFAWIASPQPREFVSPALAQGVLVFDRVEVVGNQRMTADTVRSIAGIPTGVGVRLWEINDAVQRLHQSDLFENVAVRPEGNRLIIEVDERPTINQIAIEGNEILNDEVLLSLVTSEPRQTFSPARAESDAQNIVDAYMAAGRLSAEVTPRIIRRTENRVDLVFEVFEGGIVEIARVGFVGNRSYSDRRLRRVLATKQANLLSWLFRSDTFIEERLESDRALLEEFYLSRGFIDFEILSVTSELTRERDGFLVTFRLREGAQFFFGEITISSELPEVNVDAFADLVDISHGEIFDEELLEELLDDINLRTNELGYTFVQSAHSIRRNNESQTVDVNVELVRGPRQFIERIEISGNSTTLDHVIRREFRVVEGDPFNRREILRAQDRIRALGYFSNVTVETRPGSAPDQAIVEVTVEERPTGSLTFGVAYATDEGVAGNIALREANFAGRGQKVGVSLSVGKSDNTFAFSFEEPRFLDRDLAVGISVYHERNTSDSFTYNSREIGMRPRVSFPVSTSARLELSYVLNQARLERRTGDDTNNNVSISPLVGESPEGKTLTSAIGARYVLNKTDSFFQPSEGYRFSIGQTLAGLGGDVRYSKTSGNFTAYSSLLKGDVILSSELEAGFFVPIGANSRVSDRFFLGGDSFRGFQTFGIGPRDENNSPLGGKYFAIARLEGTFPLGLPDEVGLTGGIFIDAGSLWGLDVTSAKENSNCVDTQADPCTRVQAQSPDFELRSSTGFALYWNTAIGPLAFNFSRPLKYIKGVDRTERFRLTIGTRF